MIGAEMTLPQLLDLCKKTGAEGVELRTTHKHGVEVSLDKAARDAVKKTIQDSGIVLWGLGTACEFHSKDPYEVKKNIELTNAFVDLARDLGAKGVKVRPNGLKVADGVPKEKTLEQIALAYRQCGEYGAKNGIELWMEVHGRETSDPRNMHSILKQADHPNCFACWNSNGGEPDEKGSIRWAFDLLKPWIRSVHINELITAYPWKELFDLLKANGYGDRFTLAEIQGNPDPERFFKYYRALWAQLTR